MNANILVVDDETNFRVLAQEALTAEGFEVRVAGTLTKARKAIEEASPDVIVLDRRLPDGDGLDFLKKIRAESLSGPIVIVVTAYGDVTNAVEALKSGATDYLTKPVHLADLTVKLRKALEARGLRDRLTIARNSSVKPKMVEPISQAMKETVYRLKQVSTSPMTPVLLQGPSGSGKQYAAEMLHELTWKEIDADAPFVELNCSALPEQLIESELFGAEKGAFTDAKSSRRGLFEMADGGTLFLDEIAELPLIAQAKLLKFLDTMRFRRLGGEREISVRLRLVAASNSDIVTQVKKGRMREDLYHRMAVFCISIPALSERREDIKDLAQEFVRFFGGRVKKRLTGISPSAMARLESYGYPGNVRELRNIIERAVILCQGPEITEKDLILATQLATVSNDASFFSQALNADGSVPSLQEIESQYVSHVLRHLNGQRTAAAQALGISYPTFLKYMKEG
jgi:two-component system, NtrC family, response regulator AtoC